MTTSMEAVSTGILDKKEHYLRSKDKAAEKIICFITTYKIAYVKINNKINKWKK